MIVNKNIVNAFNKKIPPQGSKWFKFNTVEDGRI